MHKNKKTMLSSKSVNAAGLQYYCLLFASLIEWSMRPVVNL